MNQQLAVNVEAAVVRLPDERNTMPLAFTERRWGAACEGWHAAAMDAELVVLYIDGDFIEAVGQAIAIGLHQIE